MARVSVFLGILIVALFFRFWQLPGLPPGFHFDESFEGLEAWRILTDSAYRPVFLTGNFGVPPLNAYANAITFGLFRLMGGEAGPLAMRTTAAVFGVLGVAGVFALGDELRRLDSKRLTVALPFFAAGLLATMRWHVHFSRMGIEPVIVPLLWAASTWLYLRGWRTGSWWAYAGCGLLLAAAMYTYQGAWIIPLLMAPVALVLWWHQRQHSGDVEAEIRRRQVTGSAIAAGLALLLVIPLLLFFAQNPSLALLRPSQIAVTGGAAATGDPLYNTFASVRMFVPLPGTGDLDPRRNLPGEAALNWWQFAPFVAGALIALIRISNPAYSILWIGLVGLLLPGVFTEYAPHFHRILGASAPVAILAAVGLDMLVRLAAGTGERIKASNWGVWVGVFLIVAGALNAAYDYFYRWAALPDLFHAFDAGLWQIGREAGARAASETIYVTPRNADHPTLAFAWTAQTHTHAAPISFDGRKVFPVYDATTSAPETYIVIEDEDFRTRLLLPEVLPQAFVSETIFDSKGKSYADFFTRPPGEAAARPPQHAITTELGDGIRLAGYDAQSATTEVGKVLYLQLHWLVDATPTTDWTVFTHLTRRDANGELVQVAGSDGQPGGGSLPTTRWRPGWRVLDEYEMALPADLPPGDYQLEVGMYKPDGGHLPDDGSAIQLGGIALE